MSARLLSAFCFYLRRRHRRRCRRLCRRRWGRFLLACWRACASSCHSRLCLCVRVCVFERHTLSARQQPANFLHARARALCECSLPRARRARSSVRPPFRNASARSLVRVDDAPPLDCGRSAATSGAYERPHCWSVCRRAMVRTNARVFECARARDTCGARRVCSRASSTQRLPTRTCTSPSLPPLPRSQSRSLSMNVWTRANASKNSSAEMSPV